MSMSDYQYVIRLLDASPWLSYRVSMESLPEVGYEGIKALCYLLG
jgi:hypothetical protein